MKLKRFFLVVGNEGSGENPAIDPVITDLVAKETFNNYVSYVGDYVAWAVLHYRGSAMTLDLDVAKRQQKTQKQSGT